MKRFMILLIFATLFTLTGLTLEGKNSKGATVTLTKNVFTLEPGQNITLSGKVALQPGIKPQVWGCMPISPIPLPGSGMNANCQLSTPDLPGGWCGSSPISPPVTF